MGNFWENSGLTRDDVLKNIFQINQISKTLVFMKKLKVHLIFELDDESSSRRKSRKIIKVTIYDYDNKTCMVFKRKKPIHITIENFYNYFNLLMNTKNTFLQNQLNQNLQRSNNDEDESDLCPICTENNVNISLPCSHFFCEDCIKGWLIKSQSCPLCRYKLKLNKKAPSGVSGAQNWDIVEDVNQEQLEKENMESLCMLTDKLFIKNNHS